MNHKNNNIDPKGFEKITLDNKGQIVSPFLFGNNLEHTRSCVNGGLSAQMLKNRKFIGKPSPMEGVAQCWYLIGEKTYCSFAPSYTHHYADHYHMRRRLECNSQVISNLYGNEICGIGQHEIHVMTGESYEFAIVAKAKKDTDIKVALTDRFGKTEYASFNITVVGKGEWDRYTAELTVDVTDEDADIRLTLGSEGTVVIGAVSLMNSDNFRGMRRDVIKCMQDMGIKLLRWPGGNFAGEYNWIDGLLPRDERAPFESYQSLETQPHSLGYDFHEINTDDFIALCREIGAEPIITINLAWNTPEESAAWVEYCNGDITTEYGRLRAERGNPEPYNVMLWSLGNEFGYGHMEGDNSASGYARLAHESGRKMLEKNPNLAFCSSGPYPNKEWTDYSVKPLADIAKAVSMHFYACGYDNGPDYNEDADLEASFRRCIGDVEVPRRMLESLRNDIGNDEIKISFDEWNVWYGWYRPSSVIDGIFSVRMMHMIISEANRLGIGYACHFEAVNESAIKVTPHSAYLSATGQAIAMTGVHAGGLLLYADDRAVVTKKEEVTSATLVNDSYSESKKFVIECASDKASITLYEGKNLLPHSYFELSTYECKNNGSGIEIDIPAHSAAVVKF